MGLFRKKSWVKSLIKSNEPEIKEGAKKVLKFTIKTLADAYRQTYDPVYRENINKERAKTYNKKIGE